MADLIKDVNGTYNDTQIKDAFKEVIDTYTFFDHAYDNIKDWSGPKGKLQKDIIDNYTNEIPFVMREVSSLFPINNFLIFSKNFALRKFVQILIYITIGNAKMQQHDNGL